LKATVKLFAQFRNGRFKAETIGIAEQTRVRDVVEELDIPPKEVAICLVNGHDTGIDSEINNGDTVALFPPVGG